MRRLALCLSILTLVLGAATPANAQWHHHWRRHHHHRWHHHGYPPPPPPYYR